MNTQKMDVFPDGISSQVERLQYPDFGKLTATSKVFMFLCHLDLNNRMYFKTMDLKDKDVRLFSYMGKLAVTFDYRNNYENAWHWTAYKLRKSGNLGNLRETSPPQLGFKFGNSYLVKSCFTFGQRKVQPGTVHIIQTLNVPLLFFFVNPDKKRNVAILSRLFDYRDQFRYSKRRLRPNSCYRVPRNTVYVLYTTQKCLFSLDVVKEETPFPCLNPIDRRPHEDHTYAKPTN